MTAARISIGRAELDTRPHILYRFYDRTGVLLYVGITVDFEQRWKQHAKYKDWWSRVDHTTTKVEYCLGKRAALDAERDAIKTEKPLENDQHNEWVEVASPTSKNVASDLLAELHEDITGYIATDEAIDEITSEIQGNHPLLSEDEIRVKVCSYIARDLWLSRADLASQAQDLLYLLPERLGDASIDVAYTRLREEGRGVEFDRVALTHEALYEAHGFMSNIFMENLPDAERDEWLECARAALPDDADAYTIVRKAAEHAAAFKCGRGRHMDGMCANSGDHGAMCPQVATHKIWIVSCNSCGQTGRPCRGHIGLCKRHLEVAEAGRATRGPSGAPYALLRSEAIYRTDPLAVA